MKKTLLFFPLVSLSACQNVELQYAKPSPPGDFEAAERQANDHFEFVAFPKAYILVRAVEDSVANATKNTDKSESVKSAGDQLKPISSQNGSKSSGTATPGMDAKSVAKAGVASDSGASSPAGGKKNAADAPTKHGDTTTASSPTALSDGLANAVIDGKKWEARVVLMPDDQRSFVVKGVSGFWRSTSLGLDKYLNTDMVSSVSSTAENLVPKRIGQAASIVATVVQTGSILGVDGQPIKKLPLQSFTFEVPGNGPTSGSVNDDWTYSFDFDSKGLPAGTVSFDAFSQKTANRTVSYWPVPACRSATLRVGRASDHSVAAFHLTVSSSGAVRLQPLPVSGKVDFGSVCGATTSGTATSDPVSIVSDDLAAVQQAVKTIKEAKSADAGASGAAAGASAPK